MGQPSASHVAEPRPQSNKDGEHTRRSETSQYPQTKEINRDCPSSGERTGNSPNADGVKPTRVAASTLWGLLRVQCRAPVSCTRIAEGSGAAHHRR